MLLLKYDEDQIMMERDHIPVITYEYEDKTCKFYPDFYIPHDNKIIEVKSTYTYKAFYSKNQTKIISAALQGYDIEYWIFNKGSDVIEFITAIVLRDT